MSPDTKYRPERIRSGHEKEEEEQTVLRGRITDIQKAATKMGKRRAVEERCKNDRENGCSKSEYIPTWNTRAIHTASDSSDNPSPSILPSQNLSNLEIKKL